MLVKRLNAQLILVDALLITVLRVVCCIFKCPPDATSNELVAAASGTPLLQAISGTVTNPAKNTGTSSVTNEGKLVGNWIIIILYMSSFLTGKFISGAPTCTGQPSCPSCSSVAKSGSVF